MSPKLTLGYFAHTLRSDWNNGNAHFLRGLMRAMCKLGHAVTVFEPEREWSIENLSEEAEGRRSLHDFASTYSDLEIQTYESDISEELLKHRVHDLQIVILHEWNPPALARMLLRLRAECGYKLLFHDTHHRASSSPEQIELYGLREFDGVIAFGNALRDIYQNRFGVTRVWTLHEAADVTVFKPHPEIERGTDLVWIGNWGEGERAEEIRSFLLNPAHSLNEIASTTIYGVRYPEDGLRALAQAGVHYGGYLPNLDAPMVYARAGATVHVPRQQYSGAMQGIPTIRVFETLACGIPLVSAPWQDSEELFRKGDFLYAATSAEMTASLRFLLTNRAAAEDQAARGRETILTRHTCDHRARELTAICEEALQ